MTEQLSQRKRNMIFIVIVITCIICSMLSTALTTALPQMMKDLEITAATGQWLTSIYSLVMGILVLATAFLIKRFKTKPLYLSALGIFMLGLLLNAFTSSFAVMMAGRILQAAGNGILLSLGQVILLTIYPREKRGSIMGVYGLAVGAAPIIAPALAGIVVDAFGWRMIFYALLLFTAIAFVITAVVFENVLENEKLKFDFLSFALCAAGFSGILLGVGNLGSYSLVSQQTLLPLGIGLISCILFVYRQLHIDTPFLELRILNVLEYRIAVIASMLLYAYLMALSVLMPVYIQTICEKSATVSGLVVMPGSIMMALVSPFAGKIYDKVGIKTLFVTGAVLMAGSSLGMAFMDADSSMLLVALINVFRNISTGILMMPFVTWGMSALGDKDMAHGTSLLTSLRTVAGAFGAAIFMAVYSIISQNVSQVKGMSIAFVCLTAVGIVELGVAGYVAFIRKK